MVELPELVTVNPTSDPLYIDPSAREERPDTSGGLSPEWKAYWNRKLARSQFYIGLVMDGKAYARLAHANGGFGEDVCHDCHALVGMLHVPGCDMEKCPKCGGQLISCGHTYTLGNGDGRTLL